MNIRKPRELKKIAAQRLSDAGNVRQIALIYAGVAIGLSALVTVLTYALDLRIDQLGGLRNMSSRRILSTLQSVLPIAQMMVSICLEVGFVAAMLRVARGQYVSQNTLRLGFDRFWVLMRSTVVQCCIYLAVLTLGVYVGIMIYMATPLANDAVEFITPYLSEISLLNSEVVLDQAVYAQFAQMIWPAYLICAGLICILIVPVWYSYRMVNYIIIDHPGMGAMAALRESRKMMRKNRLQMFKLDVSLWWYYLAALLASAVCYGDVILPLLGVELPMSETVSYFLFYALYLLLSFGIYCILSPKAQTVYALAYDALKPEEKKDNGVVLGNIFQM